MVIDINLSVEETIAAIKAELRAKGLDTGDDEAGLPPQCEWCGAIDARPWYIYSGRGDVVDGEYCDDC
jgi:hypothetical protein